MYRLFKELLNNEPSAIAIESKAGSLTYEDLFLKVNLLAFWIVQQNIKSLALQAENSTEWIILDLACQKAGVIFTPIPLFFTQEQFDNVVNNTKPELIFSDHPLSYGKYNNEHGLFLQCFTLIHAEKIDVPKGTSKITFTSGSTGTPKGVCLSIENQLNVATSLISHIGLDNPRHLCLLPLPTLLENIAGIYAPMLAGGTVIIANDFERGFSGSRLVAPQALINCIQKAQPHSLILVPELLHVLIQAIENGWPVPSSLKFIAVGGSKVSSLLIVKARKLKLPVYQGYGLSECGSVVSLCSPNDDVNDSAGILLPHLTASIENDELVVEGNAFLGYLGDKDSWYQTRIYTGDIAEIKQENIYITGRRKNIIINSFGRNISPEWVESEILSCGIFQQAVLIGDNKPFCIMILVPISPEITVQKIENAITLINTSLPDYAQIKGQITFDKPMLLEDGLYTANGRPKREEISKKFKSKINHYYLSSSLS